MSESKPEESAPVVAVPEQPETVAPAEAPADAPTDAADAAPEEKKPREPLSPEEAAKRKAERAEKRKEQRKASRQAIKEAKAAGEPVKPKAPKAAKAGDVEIPEGAAPKITVARIPVAITTSELKALFEPFGTILRAEVSKRKGRPTIGTVLFNTNADVKRAINGLHGKHKCAGEEEAVSIQYAKDAKSLGELLKNSTDGIADTLREYQYKPGVLRSKDAKDIINKLVFTKRNVPSKELLTAALLVHTGSASAQELLDAKLITSTAEVKQLLQGESKTKPEAAVKAPAGKAARKEDVKPAAKVDNTFDAVVPRLDKLEKDRWNRMAKANLRLNERHRFRFVDILATPSLELWRWMVEDCDMTPAEAGTCFAILQNYYGFSK